MLLSECVTISDQGCSFRVIHVPVGEGIAHVRALGEGSGSGPRVIGPLPRGLFCVRAARSDCRGLSIVCFDLHRCSSLRLGAVRQLADACGQLGSEASSRTSTDSAFHVDTTGWRRADLCTRIEMIRLSACVSLPLGEDDALRGLVTCERLSFLGTLV